MTLLSIKKDLQERTLRAVTGLLAKLEYIAGLRQLDGSYSHWGLSRVHGEETTQRALAETHENLVSAVLRTPLRKLASDVGESCANANVPEVEFLQALQAREAQLVPSNAGTGSRRHLSSVLRALVAMIKSSK
jgi:hypothetical protein